MGSSKASPDTPLALSPSWLRQVQSHARRFGMTTERYIRDAVRHYRATIEGHPLPAPAIKMTPEAIYRQQASKYQKERWAKMTPDERKAIQATFSQRATERWQRTRKKVNP